MIEFPAIQNLVAKAEQKAVLRFLRSRFGTLPEDVERIVCETTDMRTLDNLLDHMGDCKSIDQFRQLLKGEGRGNSPQPSVE